MHTEILLHLMQVCAGLSSRLQEYKSENAQLEGLLQNEVNFLVGFLLHFKQHPHFHLNQRHGFIFSESGEL